MNKATRFLLPGFFFLLFSCDLLRDSPFVVEAWSPGAGFKNDPLNIRVSVLFSGECDKVKTEQAFSITEDHKRLKGEFVWENYRLVFIPSAPLEAGRDYFITIGTGAQDIRGISLENKFEASFTTRVSGGKPEIIGTMPKYGGSIGESRGEYDILFSGPVVLDSCFDFISFTPSTPGSWRLENDNKTARFIPREPWQAGTLYRVSVDPDFKSVSGSVLGTGYSSVFSAGTDSEKPFPRKVIILFPGDDSVTGTSGKNPGAEISPVISGSSPPGVYGAFESFNRIELVFSEPVDLSLLRNLISVDPGADIVMESPPGFSERAVFRFARYPAWGSVFLFTLLPGLRDSSGNESDEEYVFKINCSGPFSKPPALKGIRFPLIPESGGGACFSETDLFGNFSVDDKHYRSGAATDIWIELYFETAPGTEIDPFSVMELFRVDATNRAINFTPKTVKTENFTLELPEEKWKDFKRLEIRGLFTNTVQSGIVTFRIPPGLKDKRGNESFDDFSISLLK